MVGSDDPTFFIKSGDMGFTDRQKNIFEQLSVAEKERNERNQESYQRMEEVSKGENAVVVSRKRTRSQMKQFRGKESIFKKPDAPPPRFKNRDNIPDYQRNPHKWVKYSLGDISQEDMSERTNTAAALSFLREMEERKGHEKMEIEETSSQIAFRQLKYKSKLFLHHDTTVNIVPDANTSGTSEGEEKPSFRSSKLIMPEYVVGMTKRRDKKKNEKLDRISKNETVALSQVTLEHLVEEEEDE